MVTGTINPRGCPIIRVTVCHPNGRYRHDLDVMVDTGCEVELVLSSLEIAALGLPYSPTQTIQLGDGTTSSVQIFDGMVEWFGAERLILVYESRRGLPLLGARLLSPHTLVVDYGNGTVEIR